MEERVNLSIRVEPCVAITTCIKGFLSRTVDSYIAQGADPLKKVDSTWKQYGEAERKCHKKKIQKTMFLYYSNTMEPLMIA